MLFHKITSLACQTPFVERGLAMRDYKITWGWGYVMLKRNLETISTSW